MCRGCAFRINSLSSDESVSSFGKCLGSFTGVRLKLSFLKKSADDCSVSDELLLGAGFILYVDLQFR